MSLELSSLISGSFPSAVETNTKLAVGTEAGQLRVYGSDHVLERELRVGKQAVSRMAIVPLTEILAVICDRKCSVHDLGTRRKLLDIDSTSAKYLATVKGAIVLGSSYKLRIVRFVGLESKLNGDNAVGTQGRVDSSALAESTVSVVSVDQQKVRALGVLLAKARDSRETVEDCIFAIIGQKFPKLWRVDLTGSGRMIPVMNLDPRKYGNAHHFCLAGTDNNLIVGCSSGSMLIQLNPLQIVCELGPISRVTVVNTERTNLSLLAVLENKNSRSRDKVVKVLNPTTGNTLFSTEVDNLVGPSLVSSESTLARMKVNIKVSDITHLSDGALLAFDLSAEQVTDEIRELQRREVASIFARNEIDEAMRLLTLIEEQETSNFANYKFACEILLPYLKETKFQESSSQNTQKSLFSSRSELSIRSGLSSRPFRRHHLLDSVVQYLTYTRRKLRLRSDIKSSHSDVDTALFLCYLVMQSPLLTSLLRSHNSCDPDTVESSLLEREKWCELIWFYKGKSNATHDRKALNLLVEHNEPPEKIVAYLESVQDLQLVFEFAQPVLRNNPKFARQLFYERGNATEFTSSQLQEQLDEEIKQIYEYLLGISTETAQDFALFRVFDFGDRTRYLNNEVAQLLADLRDKRLLKFLETSDFIDAPQLISNKHIPKEGKAILYSRIEDYSSAIDIYVDLKDYEKAQELAEEHEMAQYLFNVLQASNSSESQKVILHFLNTVKPSSGLEMKHTLQNLPADMQVNQLRPFMTEFVVAQIRKANFINSLEAVSRRTLAEKNIEAVFGKSKKFTVSKRDACNLCHKTLGRVVTGVSDDQLMHYKCLNNNK